MTTHNGWIPAFVLPNLTLHSAIECAHAALVPTTDPRIAELAAEGRAFAEFLERFTDAFDVPLAPAVLLCRPDSPATYRTVEAVAAFRNVVALSVVPFARATLSVAPYSQGIFWSDVFAFYPWMVGSPPDERFVAQSPALLAVHSVDEFRGQSSPTAPVMSLSPRQLDRPIFETLVTRWERAFAKKSRGHDDTKLFRSLNMAYNAALTPTLARETLVVDVGRLLALWVSAFEILVHTGPGGNASRDKVMDVLDNLSEWCRPDVAGMTFPVSAGRNNPPRLRKLPSWFYLRLRNVRNDFLHGNPVTPTSHRVEPRGTKSLLDIAAPLYRLALGSVLGIKAPPSAKPGARTAAKMKATIRRETDFVLYQRTCEDALVASLGKGTYKKLFGRPLPPLRRPSSVRTVSRRRP